MNECGWFHDCHKEATQDVEHPTLGWVPICPDHLTWLTQDVTDGRVNPTRLVPPMAAAHARRLNEILAQVGLEGEA